MRTSLLALTVSMLVLSGCRSQRHIIRDQQRSDSGILRKAALYHNPKSVTAAAEYFPNGSLKSEEWSVRNHPVMRLQFYDNARLQSEERFRNGQLTYGAYYTPDGSIEKTQGRLRDPGPAPRQTTAP